MKVTVVGAGVIGITSAIRLREAGFSTDIVAADLPADTAASSVAGAIWYPYGSSPDSRAAGWGRHSLGVFTELAEEAAPGLALKEMLDLRVARGSDPWWADPGRGFRHADGDGLPPGYAGGFLQQTVVIDVVPHLEYLSARFESLGGRIAQEHLTGLDDLAAEGLVVNCTGVGAGTLVGDPGVTPIRGQVVRVGGVNVQRVTIVDEGPLAYAYVMPHGSEAVLGGTRRPGQWDRTPDEAVSEQILEKAVLLEPALAAAEVIGVKVGLRPGRERVRLEHEAITGTPGIIHNYGHAGNGWSLSWGCADEVVVLATRAAG